MLLGSFKSDETLYLLSINNSSQTEKYGIPYEKSDIVEIKIGDATWWNIAPGEVSTAQYVKQNAPLEIVCTYNNYIFNSGNNEWEFKKKVTKHLGTEIFNNNEKFTQFVTYLNLNSEENCDMLFSTYGQRVKSDDFMDESYNSLAID